MTPKERGQIGGLRRAHVSRAARQRDLAECRAYLAAHPGAKAYDVALELHYTDEAARRITAAVGRSEA